MKKVHQVPTKTFGQWAWQKHKLPLAIVFTLGLIIFVSCTWMFPFPYFAPYSKWLLEASVKGTIVGKVPMGYPIFIRFFAGLSNSFISFVLLQYILLQVTTIYFILSTCYLFKLDSLVKPLLFTSLALYPVFFFISNLLTNDALFAAGTALWITQLLWILYRPKLAMVLIHGLLLVVLIAIRFHALYYPFISLGVVLSSEMQKSIRRAALGSILLFLGIFIGFVQYQYSVRTTTTQFLPQAGWQLASNALCAYIYVVPKNRDNSPHEFNGVEKLTNHLLDTTKGINRWSLQAQESFYSWNPKSPLHRRMKVPKSEPDKEFQYWSIYAPYYRRLGFHLIRLYPIEYLKHFVVPNIANYAVLQAESLLYFNRGKPYDQKLYENLFAGYPPKADEFLWLRHQLMNWYGALFSVFNLLLILGFFGLKVTRGNQNNRQGSNKGLALMAVIWLSNFAFSVLFSPIVFRLQIAPLTTMFFFSIIIVYLIVYSTTKPENEKLQVFNPANNFSI